jgi:hypothetical protein
MAYIDADHAATGTRVLVDLCGTPGSAVIVDLPFYRRTA